MLHENLSIFKEVLGPAFSPEQFILSVEKEGVLRPLINHDEMLLGLILGYGREASIAFKKHHEQIEREEAWIAPLWTENYTGVEATPPKKCRIFPVEFVGDPKSKEVSHLLDLYTEELEGIWKTYRSTNDPLKLVLERL